ncbi:hypothetical protein Pan44_03060 [Caulifigura coniformis]|uniref:Bacterial Ig-like domain (Group 2) n=1 Tax=Caulifigura coniformis TaxID=2527983 RepID=A0A517S850_9PLAN|nr:DUF1549 domain-containing protein [Caulifigura coniformis]QDT52297.1 hypothetical protein Pan44_03060 [Caulifigura coniformis]
MFLRLTIIALALVASDAGAADLVELRVSPPEINLAGSQDRQAVLVQAIYSDGITRDVADKATFAAGNAALLRQEGQTFWAAADGQTELKVSFEGKECVIPVKVEKAAETKPISFKLDVMPVFMKTGCNSGSCHGAARGKDGFRLSLFGYDPDGDHYRITRELSGRRVDLAVPAASLLVEKGVGAVPHTGGKRIEPGTEIYQNMVNWIAAGCQQDPADIPTCTSIDLYPKNAVLDGEGETQKLTVRATYSDGTDRDVTHLALFLTNNESSAAVSPEGVVKAGARGEAFVMARFATHTVGSQFIVLPKGLNYAEPAADNVNYIDELVSAKLKKLRLLPSGQCTDEEFLRRISIDLVGLLPTREEYAAFTADANPNKREAKIDELIARKDFTDVWVSKWAEWLMLRSDGNRKSYKMIVLYHQWVSEKIASNTPLDQMVKELLASNGGIFKNPEASFYEIERDRLKIAENTAQIFMGMRIQCAQCHNHPFDRWTQDEYYNFAAFFAQVGRKTAEDPREQIIFNSGGGEVKHPVSGKNMEPVFLGGGPADTKGKDRREVLAEWLASPKNPFFAQNFANRVWDHFFGMGIINPVDDVRVSNPASNPELLAELAKRFTESNYNFKQLVKEICMSRTYQRTTERNESNQTDERNFAHQNVRRIKAESMLDIVSQVTNTKDKFRGLPLGARAVEIADGNTSDYFLTTFGRATRETPCSCEVRMEPTLSQALNLMNGDVVNGKIQRGGVLKAMKEQKLEPMQIVEQLYISCLVRKPTEEEKAALAPMFAEGSDTNKALEDVFWALLNSREMLFNH